MRSSRDDTSEERLLTTRCQDPHQRARDGHHRGRLADAAGGGVGDGRGGPLVRLDPELQDKVGARIAGLLGVPAAMVTAGAASAIAVATAACMAQDDLPAIDRLPETDGLRGEVILQKGHKSRYEAQMSQAGAKLVWVETREELDRAINPRTAMMFFLNRFGPLGAIQRAEWVEVGKRRGVPTFLDAAADVPPISRLSEYIREGFDLVTFSGGKAIRGPQA